MAEEIKKTEELKKAEETAAQDAQKLDDDALDGITGGENYTLSGNMITGYCYKCKNTFTVQVRFTFTPALIQKYTQIQCPKCYEMIERWT